MKIAMYLILLILLLIYGCSNNNSIDEKYHCENSSDCVDGEYCQVTEPGGCVGAKWWWENVGNKYDCEPDPNVCTCVDNRCIKK
jgi:hypothetical protein